MQILRIIARLLDYPSQEMQAHISEVNAAILAAKELSPEQRRQLLAFNEAIYGKELLDTQEDYSHLFDRGRHLSLLLFEHVHGESRDRGQAMVDLMENYKRHGMHIGVRELPDYIPLYLEFLSHRPDLEAREGLADVSHILAILCARLQQRDSQYCVLFTALLSISGASENISALREQAAKEKPDDTLEALDKIWEEEAVTFTADKQHSLCPSAQRSVRNHNEESPLHWVNTQSA